MLRIPRLFALLFLLALGFGKSLEEAQALLKEGQYAEASLAFEEILLKDYAQREAHLGLGVALFRAGRLEEARFAFQQMTLLFPEAYEAHYNLGQVLLRLGRFGEAASALRRAAELGGTEEAYLALAAALAQGGQAKEAAEALKQGLGPDRSPAYRLALAQALYGAGERAQAVPFLYEALNREPTLAPAWDLLARVLAEEGLKARALRELDRGLQAVKGRDRALLLYRKAFLTDNPEPLLKEAYALDPGLWPAAYRLGELRLRARDYRGALDYLLAAHRMEPAPEVALALAGAYQALGDWARVYRYAGEAGPLGQVLKAQAAYRLGQKEEALKLLEGLDTPEALALKGSLFLERGEAQRALEALQRAYAQAPSPETGANLGAALVALGRLSEAETLLRGILAQNPRLAPAWYTLGLALRGLGRESEAQRAFRQASDLGLKEAQALLGR